MPCNPLISHINTQKANQLILFPWKIIFIVLYIKKLKAEQIKIVLSSKDFLLQKILKLNNFLTVTDNLSAGLKWRLGTFNCRKNKYYGYFSEAELKILFSQAFITAKFNPALK